MLNLVKADLFRIIKSKLAIVSLIIVAATPILVVGMYYGISLMMNVMDDSGELGLFINAKILMANSFSVSDNVGLVVPVFASIFVALDVSNGTLRNKVIAGHSRTSIYFSHLICSILYSVVMIVLYATLTTLLGLAFFDYGVEIDANEIKNIIYTIINGITTFAFMATIATLFALIIPSVAPAIIFTVLVAVALSLAAGISGLLIGASENAKHFVYLIPTYATSTSLLGTMDETVFLEGMASYAFFGGLNIYLALLVFRKKDLK